MKVTFIMHLFRHFGTSSMISSVLGTVLTFICCLAPPFARAEIGTGFEKLDADKDGKVTLQEAGRRRGLTG